MKNAILLVLAAFCAAFAQGSGHSYRLTFCTTVSGVDYCTEHEAKVKFDMSKTKIIARRYEDVIYDMDIVGKWVRDPVTGDSSVTVSYNGSRWTFASHENSYTLDDHRCASVEFWHGTRKAQRAQHGYIRTDAEDMLSFTGTCEADPSRPAKLTKRQKTRLDYLGRADRSI